MLNRGRATRISVLIFSLSLLAYSFSACRGRSSGQERRYDLKGKLVSIDEKGRQLIIAHEAIEGFMEAMTMPFSVKEGWPFKGMEPGDTIQATLVVDGDRTWLEEIMWSREAADASAAADAANSIEAKPGDEVPDFAMVNQDGKRISLHQYRGRALALNFIYTRCPLPDYCPLMSENFATIEKALALETDLYAQTHLISISVDPEYDTPKVMRDYGAAYAGYNQSAFAHWEFATGSKEEIKNVAAFFGLAYWQEADQIIHNLRTAIIAPDGKLFKIYQGNQWKPEEILSDLRSLKAPDQAKAGEGENGKRSKPSVKTYQAKGVIESVDRDNAIVQVNHEDIKEVMPAMSMPFKVKDKAMLESLAQGDRVEFSLQMLESGFVVVAIKKR